MSGHDPINPTSPKKTSQTQPAPGEHAVHAKHKFTKIRNRDCRWSNHEISPGDIIFGNVTRSAFLQRGIVTITIKLHGRLQSSVTSEATDHINNTTHSTWYGSGFEFFTDGSQETSQLIHDGPVDISGDNASAEWPFAIRLPELTHMSGQKQIRDRTLLPASHSGEASDPLPDTFSTSHGGGASKRTDACVDYYIEAEMKMTGESPRKATCPVTVRSKLVYPISDFQECGVHKTFTVSTYRLQPKLTELSFCQKRRQFFHSSKVLKFGVKLGLTIPKCVQLFHKTFLPIKLAAKLIDFEVSDAIQGIPQTLVLKSAKLRIIISSKVNADGRVRGEYSDHPLDAGMGYIHLDQLAEPITMIVSDRPKSINIGELLRLSVRRNGLYYGNKRMTPRGQPELQPTFTTYNMGIKYAFQWKFKFDIAGEKVGTVLQAPVLIMSPALHEEPQGLPPAYEP